MSKQGVFWVIILILCLDQGTKLIVKTQMILGQELVIFSWFKILFIENDGMAWGATIGDFLPFISKAESKLILTLFRIIALFGIGYWLNYLLSNKARRYLVIAVASIFSGALGNILDSVFYGVLFDDSFGQKATLFAKQGYANLFHGKVVDMLHFPLFHGNFPEWVPYLGGQYFTFFNPVFNIADIAISLGVGLLLFQNNLNFKTKNISSEIEKSDLV